VVFLYKNKSYCFYIKFAFGKTFVIHAVWCILGSYIAFPTLALSKSGEKVEEHGSSSQPPEYEAPFAL